MNSPYRPDPDRLLSALKAEENDARGGELRVFFGMSAGVGKTYAMLKAAHELKGDGVDVVVGVVETHQRSETEQLVAGLEVIPRRESEYRGSRFREMDLDAILARAPKVVLVDELAHNNLPGSRHPKRYQDVLELLDAGISVYTTLNVQHLESQIDIVHRITGITVRETVPDSVLARANQITLVDITPAELLERLREGKVYLGERARSASENFFKEEPLTALRELALRITAEQVESELQDLRRTTLISGRWNTKERLLVAVSHSPHSTNLIRSSRRHASAMQAPWIALHVDTGNTLAPADQEQLNRNLKLAQELGAEVITTAETDVVLAIERIARERDVTQIIVGRPERHAWRDLIQGGTLLDRLVRRSPDIDIHVIRPETTTTGEPRAIAPSETNPALRQIALTAGIVVLLTGINWMLADYIGYRAVGFVYLLAIIVLSARISFWPMIVTAALSAVTWNVLFIPPAFTLHIEEPEDIMMFFAYFIVACVTGYLTMRTHRQDVLLRQRELRTEALYEFVRALVGIKSVEELTAEIDSRTQRLFQARSILLLASRETGDLMRQPADAPLPIDESEWGVASWSFKNEKIAGWMTDSLPEARSMCLPLIVGDRCLGVLLIRPIERSSLSREQLDLLRAIVHQTAVAVEREQLQLQMQQMALLQESEKLHQTLLSSISHELRTPLTAISGTAAALGNEVIAADAAKRAELLGEIVASTARLNHVIENLLDMSRLESGILVLEREWFDLEELVEETLRSVRESLAGHEVQVKSPSEAVIVRGDFRLLQHVLANLLRNAATYSPPNTVITVEITRRTERAFVTVADCGPGIKAEDRNRIFEKFYRPTGSRPGGVGLGLAIARSIVELHEGRIAADSAPQGGTRITVELPQAPPPSELRGEQS